MSYKLRAIIVLVITLLMWVGVGRPATATSQVILVGSCSVARAQATLDPRMWYLKLYSGNQSRINGPFIGPTTAGMTFNFSPALAFGSTVVVVILDSTLKETSIAAFYVCTSNASPPCSNPDLVDGRLNAVCADPTQTAALFCYPDSASIPIDVLRDSKGVFAFAVTTGELQFNTPNNDIYIFRHLGGQPVTFFQMCTGAATWYRPGQR